MSENRFHARPIRGWLPGESEKSRADRIEPATIVNALRLVEHGEIYDLDVGRWAGMPMYPSEPPFQVLSYRTPPGLRAQNDFPEWAGAPTRAAWIGDLIICGMHSGTHIDALSHMTVGEDDHWYGGHTAREHLGDFGPIAADAAAIPPIIGRGVLIDVAGYREVPVLPPGYAITVDDVKGALERQETELAEGDTVLVHTGYLGVWGTEAEAEHFGCGVGVEASVWLADQGVVAIGADNEGVEPLVFTEEDMKNPLPAHIELLIKRGVYMIEMVYLEELARDQIYKFLFLCLPPKIRGTTGAVVRAVAVV